jgi:hypothetical protein
VSALTWSGVRNSRSAALHALPRVQHRGQKVFSFPLPLAIALVNAASRLRRHDLLHPRVGPRDAPIRGPRDLAPQRRAGPLQRRRDEAERHGQGRRQVHLERRGGVARAP